MPAAPNFPRRSRCPRRARAGPRGTAPSTPRRTTPPPARLRRPAFPTSCAQSSRSAPRSAGETGPFSARRNPAARLAPVSLPTLPPELRTPVPGPRSRALAERLREVESRDVTCLAPEPPIFWERAGRRNAAPAVAAALRAPWPLPPRPSVTRAARAARGGRGAARAVRRLGDARPVHGRARGAPRRAPRRRRLRRQPHGRDRDARPAGAAISCSASSPRVAKIAVGGAQYSVLCREDGGVLDDLFTYKLGDDRYLTVTNASNHAKDLAWFHQAGPPASTSRSSTRPTSTRCSPSRVPTRASCSQKLTDAELPPARRPRIELAGGRAAGGTGYTGEYRLELLIPPTAPGPSGSPSSSRAPPRWAGLLAAGEASGRSLAEAVRADAAFTVDVETIAATPFARLVQLRRRRAAGRRSLLLAPHSGYATACSAGSRRCSRAEVRCW